MKPSQRERLAKLCDDMVGMGEHSLNEWTHYGERPEATPAQIASARLGVARSEQRIADWRTIASILRREGWRPIEEAPKDGTIVLGYWAIEGIDCPIGPARHRADGNWEDDIGICTAPTHWMPLPEPPEQEEK